MEISILMETLPEGVPPELMQSGASLNGKLLDVTAGTARLLAASSDDSGRAPPPRLLSGTDRTGAAESSSSSASQSESHAESAPAARKPILAAKFTMVARDPVNGKAAPVNQLRLDTDEERRLFRLATEQRARKQFAQTTSLTRRPPSAEEMVLVHDLYLEYNKYLDPSYHMAQPDNVVWMKDTAQ
ncbi:hypothetical protein HK405_014413, partial [Cladochytrium tenue]